MHFCGFAISRDGNIFHLQALPYNKVYINAWSSQSSSFFNYNLFRLVFALREFIDT